MDGASAQACRFIINADDFGRTSGINRGILDAHRRGVVTSATLMVGFAASAEAARALPAHPRLGVGLHVTLTGGGRTVAVADQEPSLVDAEGLLPRSPEGLAGARAGDVVRELRAQLARFVDLVGRPPTHLDSHHHSHRLPAVCAGLIEVARTEGLPVRNASPEVASALRAAGIVTTDRFVERFFGACTDVPTLLDIVAGLEPGTTELMCHPAQVDEALRRSSSYTVEREEELAALCDPRVVAALEDRAVHLLHFGDLKRSEPS